MTDRRPSLWDEIIDFLVSQPTLEQIAAFEGSAEFQEYVRDLRDKNRNRALSNDERRMMDEIGDIGRFMRGIKLRALEKIAEAETMTQP